MTVPRHNRLAEARRPGGSTAIATHALRLGLNPLDAHSVLSGVGTFGLFLVIFAETGLLIGFFLPGDSLLFTAGVLCTTRADRTLHLSLPAVLLAAGLGAVLGAQVGYVIGRGIGPRLRERPAPRLRQGMERAEVALDRYGPPKAIVLARFIPVVRTLLNPVAGALRVPSRVFTMWQVIGGIAWSIGVTLAGYGLGSRIPGVDRYLLPIVAAVVVVSLLPVALEVRRERRRTHA